MLTSSTVWSDIFQERLDALPFDTETLRSELREITCAYADYCVALNARVENLRRPKLHPSRTPSASSLPAEILLLIFSTISEDEPMGDLCEYRGIRIEDSDSDVDSDEEGDDSDHITPSCPYQCDCWLHHSLQWARITHVCAHWRRIAIDNPTLWTNITLNLSTPWLHALVSRSRNLPLDITIPCDANWDAVEPILSECIHRARSISAERGSDIINTILQRYRAPLLEILDIDQSIANSDPFIMPPDMNAFLPQLRRLHCPVVTFPPEVQYSPSLRLTHLTVLSSNDALSVPELRGLLHALPLIQVLQLENCLPRSAEDISPQTICLAHLKTLILRGLTSSCGAIMRAIAYSSSTNVTLYMLPDEEHVLQGAEFMQRSGIGTLLQTACATPFHSLHISCVESRPNNWQFVVAGLRNPCHIDRYVRDDTRFEPHWTGPSYEDMKVVCMLPAISIDGNDSSHILALSLFTLLITTLPLATLNMLSLKVDTLLTLDTEPWNCARWLSLLKEAEKLEHIQLIARPWELHNPSKHAQPCLYADLLLALSLGPHVSRKCLLSPELSELSLINIDASSTVVIKAGPNRYLRTTAARVLHFFLSSRKDFGRQNVHVANTGISWQRHFFGEADYGPLVKMGGEIVDMKEEVDQERVHSMITEAVTRSFPASDLAL
ncbi:unnamed protein product [Peniophora sp. CBMAI 1063]|nr:unnamed protein product [Peniophora sp. CBMAI 1063]